MSSPNIESDGQAQELQSISSTNFQYNRQADSITSIPHLTLVNFITSIHQKIDSLDLRICKIVQNYPFSTMN